MRWPIILWIFVISAIAYLDRVNLSIAGKAIEAEFHLDNIQLGWVFSAFIIGYALFQTPAGRLADRMGPRMMVALGVIWWALFTVLITIVPPNMGSVLIVLMVVRFLLGAGEAIVYPASNRIVAAWIPSTERGLANGIIFSGVGFGAGITPPLITYIMLNHGWRAAFWASAALGLAAGIVWYLIARDTPAQHPWLKPEEAKLIAAGLPSNVKLTDAPMPWNSILRIPAIWLMSFSYFAYGYAAYIFFSWFFIYLSEERRLNLRTSAYYTMLPFLAMAIASPIGGLISDRLTKHRGKYLGRCGVAVAGMALSALFIALGTQVGSAQLASVVLAGGAGALYLSQSSFWSVSADIGGNSAGAVSGFMNMCGQFGGVATASLTPLIARYWGWNSSFLIAALLCACGALAWLIVEPEGIARNGKRNTSAGEYANAIDQLRDTR
jgi:ACS family glucarate transporter-like MFS transporter